MTPAETLGSFAQKVLASPRSIVLPVIAALFAAGLVSAVVTSGGDPLGSGEARLRPDGRVEVSIAGAQFTSVADDMVLAEGDRVRVIDGAAVLELPGGSAAELRQGSQVGLGGDGDAAMTLERGDLLVEVDDGTLAVDGETAEVTVGAGAAKLERSASLVTGVYEGGVIVAGQGSSLSIPPLRQVAVVGVGRLPDEGGIRPLALDEGDDWDRRYLGSILELDRRLVAFGRGFEALLPAGDAATPSLYRTLLPDLADAPLSTALLGERSAGENLIGLSLVALDDAPFDESFETVFDLRDAGARWGLVAADRGYEPPEVVDAVELAIDRAPIEVAAEEAGAGGELAAGPGSEGPSSPSSPSTSTTAPTPDGGGDDDDTTTTTTGLLPLPPSTDTTTTTTAPECVVPGVNILC